MPDILKRFDHVGIAVRSVDDSLKIYRDIMGAIVTIYKEIGTTKDYTFTQFLLGGQTIELIEPVNETKSFLTKFLDERGEGLHHLTFQVENLVEAKNYLTSAGLRLADESHTDPNWKTIFISPRSSKGVLIQIYETIPGSQYDHSTLID